jgi:hypothetical protein
MPRLVGRAQHDINYRHLVDSLLRKPGGFRDYRFQQALFPQPVFRQTWDRLNQWHVAHKADLIYLRILNLAAKYLESEVAAACLLLLEQQQRFDETHVAHLILAPPPPRPALTPLPVNLQQYDALLLGASLC